MQEERLVENSESFSYKKKEIDKRLTDSILMLLCKFHSISK